MSKEPKVLLVAKDGRGLRTEINSMLGHRIRLISVMPDGACEEFDEHPNLDAAVVVVSGPEDITLVAKMRELAGPRFLLIGASEDEHLRERLFPEGKVDYASEPSALPGLVLGALREAKLLL